MEFTVTVEGKLSGRNENLLSPVEQVLRRDRKHADVRPTRLIDRHGDRPNVIKTIEKIQCAQGVELHLRILGGIDQNTAAVLIIDYVQRVICNDNAVPGTEAGLNIF